MRITRAVVPAAGRGTRMQPFSFAVPKELAPLGSRPAIDWVVSEAVEAGVDQIAVILGPDKSLIRDYLDGQLERGALTEIDLVYLQQKDPRGLAEAIALCREFAAGEPFAVLLPDNIFPSSEHSLAALFETACRRRQDTVGLIEVDASLSGHFGNSGRVEGVPLGAAELQLHRLADKRAGRLKVDEGESFLRACGRFVFLAHVFDFIDRIRPTVSGEYSEVPVCQSILQQSGLCGRLLPGPLFDVGNPAGLLRASAYLARHDGERG